MNGSALKLGGRVEHVQAPFGAWRSTAEEQLAQPRARYLGMHDGVEALFVFEGGLELFVGATAVHVPARRLSLLWAGVPHVVFDGEPGTDFAVIHVPLDWLMSWRTTEDFHHRLLLGETLITPDESYAASDEIVVPRWVADIASGIPTRIDCARLELEARVRRLAQAYAPAPSSIAWRRDSRHVATVATYVASHYDEPLTAQQLAALVGLNAKYLMTLFRECLGMTLWSYVLRHRLANARRLLVTTDLSVLEIAFACGFGSESQFYAAFHQILKETPGAYRRRYRQPPS